MSVRSESDKAGVERGFTVPARKAAATAFTTNGMATQGFTFQAAASSRRC